MTSESKGGGRRPRYAGALRSYLRSIQQYELLTRSGEHRLGMESQRGVEDARKALVESNLRLVVKLAGEYRHPGLPMDDLIAEGNLGLLEAARRFDPARGVRFASYATWWIHKHLIAAVHRQRSQTTSPSRPAPTEAAAPVAVSAAQPEEGAGRTARARILSFEEFLQNSSDRHLLESLTDRNASDPERVTAERELEAALESVLDRMPQLERSVLVDRFGLGGRPPRTLQELADSRGLTRERIRQIEIRALERARRLIDRI